MVPRSTPEDEGDKKDLHAHGGVRAALKRAVALERMAREASSRNRRLVLRSA